MNKCFEDNSQYNEHVNVVFCRKLSVPFETIIFCAFSSGGVFGGKSKTFTIPVFLGRFKTEIDVPLSDRK